MRIRRFTAGSLMSNGYVIYHRKKGACYIIDPGYIPVNFISFVREQALEPAGIILTHLHADHTGACEAVSDALDCPIMMHENDAFVYGGHVDRMLEDGDMLDFEGEILEIILTPGHTKGSICIMNRRSRDCFTGDTIFDTDLGRTDFAGGSESDMVHSIRDIIDRWENDIMIHPGHDDSCTMKKVRMYNKEFLALRDGHER